MPKCGHGVSCAKITHVLGACGIAEIQCSQEGGHGGSGIRGTQSFPPQIIPSTSRLSWNSSGQWQSAPCMARNSSSAAARVAGSGVWRLEQGSVISCPRGGGWGWSGCIPPNGSCFLRVSQSFQLALGPSAELGQPPASSSLLSNVAQGQPAESSLDGAELSSAVPSLGFVLQSCCLGFSMCGARSCRSCCLTPCNPPHV